MKVVKLQTALRGLKPINEEIRYKECASGSGFTTGVISFSQRKKSDAKQISHPDKDVVCHVLKGRGRLRLNGRRIALQPGTICHIPKGIPHDFAATQKELVLFYSLITTR
jgi:quercetin dioxygenase-like cupin family protein